MERSDSLFSSGLGLLTRPQQIDCNYDYHADRDPNCRIHRLVPEAN